MTKIYVYNGVEIRLDDLPYGYVGAKARNGHYVWQVSVDGILDKSIHRLIDAWFDHGYAGMELDEYLDQLLEKK